MDIIWEGLGQALRLIIDRDPELVAVVLLSLAVSGSATVISILIGVPYGTLLALSRFAGRSLSLGLVNTGMAMPPVVVGLVLSILLWRSGPLGPLNLLYTPGAMVVAQVIIATPIVTGVSMAAIAQLDPRLQMQMLGLGASRLQLLWVLFQEARLPLLTAVMAGFGGVISEVGSVIMVGGNIKGQTRVLTTAIVTETGRGNFGLAIALGVILLLLAFGANLVLTHLQQRGRPAR
ncbi:MAG TPA: ABC transporter permease [Dehalococcoidia bacterium]|nr:ABC transporter permease [Dehalococcoidia bacterium]